MRILVSSTANDGHFGPLVPLARACVSAGHEIRVAAPDSFARTVQQAGFAHAPFSDSPAELVGPVMGGLASLPPQEADATVVREIFARIDAQAALPRLLETIEEWRPDLVVRESGELGSLVAAIRADVPSVHVSIGMTESVRWMQEVAAEPFRDTARAGGVSPEAALERFRHEPVFSAVPDVLDRAGDDQFDPGAVAFRFGEPPNTAAASVGALPEWGDRDAPLVYVTFGSVTGSLPPFSGVYREALDALADQPVRVLMTVGRRFAIDSLGLVPPNARVEAWWPQADVLRHASAMLGHGGFGTTLGAIAAGLPQVVVPVFTTDQAINGRHVAASGAGRTVDPGPGSVAAGCALLAEVMSDPAYRAAARTIGAELDALPTAVDAVAALEAQAGLSGS